MPWFVVRRRKVVRRVRRTALKGNKLHYLAHKEHARAVVTPRVVHFAGVYGVSHNNIAIRNQKSRWGSCSKKGNLNFHYKLVLLPPELLDYVVVHEVCHLLEFNHSRAFWALVSQQIPNYRTACKHLLSL